MTSLTDIQQSVAAAAFDVAHRLPGIVLGPRRGSEARRFDLYRRKVAASMVEALSVRYPVTRRLVGSESFTSMARVYSIQHPPRSPVLSGYGDSFPNFVRSLGRIPSIEYLASIAELEAAISRSFHAADVVTLSVEAFSRLRPDFLEELVISFHPSAALIASRFPVVSIWEAYRSDESAWVTRWGPEAALVARPDDEVQVWLLPEGGYAFLAALRRGATLAEATELAIVAAPDFDITANLELLISSRVCTGLDNLALLAA